MHVKAVIARPDRNLDIVRMKEKKLQGEKSFIHKKIFYLLDPDRFVLTKEKKFFFWNKWYTTYYYTQGMSRPLPFPDFKSISIAIGKGEEIGMTKNGKQIMDENGQPMVALKQMVRHKDIVNNGISGEELGALFDPWFYRIIAAPAKDAWAQLQFYATVANILLLVYIVYMLSGGHFNLPPIPPSPAPAGGTP